MQHFREVRFSNFKAFKNFRLSVKDFNILVGPNNAGKSTIIAAFRILSAGLRTAGSFSGKLINGPSGPVVAHRINLTALSVAGENVFYNYDDSQPAFVEFKLSDGCSLTLYFPESETCYLIPDALGKSYTKPSQFRQHFNCSIGFVPVLGPVDHDEQLYGEETARRALFNYRAARNFRNIWHHYPETFPQFQEAIRNTWPGMDVALPELERIDGKSYLKMYCPEDRIDREIVWSGFGFQVWCQMLTHLIQSKSSSIFLIDEPDIYLHSDLQRQLIGLLRELGPDIIIATHSTEIVTEAESGELILINKNKNSAKRIVNQGELGPVFKSLGSNANPILTQLAKTKKALFVEGQDFQILSRFARRLGKSNIANRSSFAVIPMRGFNPKRAEILKEGIELTLGTKIRAAAILDKDYRSSFEIDHIINASSKFLNAAKIHQAKEIENFLLVPDAIDRAVAKKISDREARSGKAVPPAPSSETLLDEFCEERRTHIQSRLIALQVRFVRDNMKDVHPDIATENAIKEFDSIWTTREGRYSLVPGKNALSYLNDVFQKTSSVNVTPSSIVTAMNLNEVPKGMQDVIEMLDKFS